MAKKEKRKKERRLQNPFLCVSLFYLPDSLCPLFFFFFQSLCDDQKKKKKSGFYRAFFVSFVTVLVVQPPLCIRWRNKHVSFFFTKTALRPPISTRVKALPFFCLFRFTHTTSSFPFSFFFFSLHLRTFSAGERETYTLPLSCFFFFFCLSEVSSFFLFLMTPTYKSLPCKKETRKKRCGLLTTCFSQLIP